MSRERFDGIGQLAQHPVANRPHEPLLERCRFPWRQEPGQLGEPHRRVPLERGDRRLAARTPAQAHQGVEEWLVRFAAAVLLRAVGPRNRHPVPLAHPGERLGQEGTLPDARLAADQAQLAGPSSGAVEGVDQELDLACSAHEPRRCRGTRSVDQLGGGLIQRPGNEPVPTTVQRLDEPRVARLVSKRPPDLLDAAGERRVRDRDVVPHGREQLVLGHDASRLACQQRKHGEGSRCQPHLAVAAREALHGVQPVGAETDHRVATISLRLAEPPMEIT